MGQYVYGFYESKALQNGIRLDSISEWARYRATLDKDYV